MALVQLAIFETSGYNPAMDEKQAFEERVEKYVLCHTVARGYSMT
jgi:hypothetical protein